MRHAGAIVRHPNGPASRGDRSTHKRRSPPGIKEQIITTQPDWSEVSDADDDLTCRIWSWIAPAPLEGAAQRRVCPHRRHGAATDHYPLVPCEEIAGVYKATDSPTLHHCPYLQRAHARPPTECRGYCPPDADDRLRESADQRLDLTSPPSCMLRRLTASTPCAGKSAPCRRWQAFLRR